MMLLMIVTWILIIVLLVLAIMWLAQQLRK